MRQIAPMRSSILFIILLFAGSHLNAQTPVTDFDQLLTALKAGKEVRTVIYYGKCELYSDGVKQEKSPDAIGGMKIETYEYFDSSVFKGRVPSFLSTSETVLINHPSYGYVYNYVKMKIKADGNVEITARYLKQRKLSAKYKVVMDETFKTRVDDGVKLFY